MTTKILILRSSVVRNAQFVCSVVITFLMTPFIVRSIGDRYFGYWSLVGAMIGYYGLLDMGISSAVERYTSRAIGRKDYESLNTTVSTSFYLFSMIGLISLIATIVLSLFSNRIFQLETEALLLRKIILILGMTISIGFPFKVYNGILNAHLRYDYISVVTITRMIFSNLLFYVFLTKGYGILAMSIISSIMSIYEMLMIYYICSVKYSSIRIGGSSFKKDFVGVIFKYSKDSFVIRVADLLRFRIDSVVIGIFLNVNLITYYVIGSKLVEYFGSVMISTVGIFIPVFSKYEGMGDMSLLRKRFLEVTRVATILSVFVGTSLLIYGRAFIRRWMGNSFDISYDICVILCVPAIIALTQTPGIQLLYGISKHKYYAWINISEGLCNIALSVVLVKMYGIHGVAMGTAIEMLIFKSIIQPIVICRAINLSYYDYFIKTIVFTGLKAIGFISLLYLIIHNYIEANYLNIFITGTLHTLLFVPFAYLFLLNSDLRDMLLSTLKADH